MNDDGLAYTSAAEDTGLAAFGEWRDQVDHFHPGLKDFYPGGLIRQRRRQDDELGNTDFSIDWTFPIHRTSQDVEHSTERHRAHRNLIGAPVE